MLRKRGKYYLEDASYLPEMLITPRGNDYLTDELGNPAISLGALRDIGGNPTIYSTRELKDNQPVYGITNKQASELADLYAGATAPGIGDLVMAGVGKPMNLTSLSHWIGALRDWDKEKGWKNIWKDNSGVLSKEYSEKHPWQALGANILIDALAGKASTSLYNSPLVKRGLQSLGNEAELRLAYLGSGGAKRRNFNSDNPLQYYVNRVGDTQANIERYITDETPPLSKYSNAKTWLADANNVKKVRDYKIQKRINDGWSQSHAQTYTDKEIKNVNSMIYDNDVINHFWDEIKKLRSWEESSYDGSTNTIYIPNYDKTNKLHLTTLAHEDAHRRFFEKFSKYVENKYGMSLLDMYNLKRGHPLKDELTNLLKEHPEKYDFLDLKDSPNIDYLLRYFGDEVKARGTQLKNYFGLTKGQRLTPRMAKYASKHYAEDVADNNMTELFNSVTDWRQFVDFLNVHSYKHGGKIYINPENRGKFNALKRRTGKTTEELTHSKNPLTRKRAIFAQNARKWKH